MPKINGNMSPTGWSVLGAVLIAVLAIYLVFPNQDFSYDAMGYARQIEGDFSVQLFHPHHLVLHAAAWGWHWTLASFVNLDSMRSAQILNSLLGVLGVFLLFRILYTLNRNFTASILLVGLTAFSFSYWYFAIEFEAYTAPLTFIIAASLILLTRPSTFTSVTGAALLTAFAVLLHQSHVLFVIPAAAYIFCSEASRRRLTFPAAFLGISGSVTLVPYLLAAQAQGHLTSVASFFRWVTLYAHTGVYAQTGESLGDFGWSNLPNSVLGLSRVVFASAHGRDALLASEIDVFTVVLVVSVMVWLVCAMLLLRGDGAAIRREMVSGELKCLSVFCGAWIVSYSLFAMIVEPRNNEYWVPVLIPFVLAAGVFVRWNRQKLLLVSVMTTITVMVNFFDSIYPSSLIENNEEYVLATKLYENGIGEGDLVFIKRSAIDNAYSYFYQATIRRSSLADPNARRATGVRPEGALHEAEDSILSALNSGRRVLVSGNEFSDLPIGTRRREGLTGADVTRFVDGLSLSRKHLFRFEIDGKEHVMYELVPR